MPDAITDKIDANIDELEAGPELDRLIARKVMEIETPELRIGENRFGRTVMMPRWEPKPYSKHIAAAWEVVEKLDRTIKVQRNFRDGDEAWHVSMWDVAVWAPTAPLAICRAALKAVIK